MSNPRPKMRSQRLLRVHSVIFDSAKVRSTDRVDYRVASSVQDITQSLMISGGPYQFDASGHATGSWRRQAALSR